MTLILSQPHKAVTAEIVNEYFHTVQGKEPYVDAALFELVAERYGLNWLGLWAMSIVETGYFTSPLFKEKRNLFGLGAVDGKPENAAHFVSLEEGAKAGAQHLAVYAGSPKVRDLPETAFVLGRTYQLLRWGWFGIAKEFGDLGGVGREGKIVWASNPHHGREVESIIASVTRYAIEVEQKPEPLPEKPKENWLVHLLTLAKVGLPIVIKFFPPLALYAGAAYALIDILLKVFG